MATKEICHKCQKEFPYDEALDMENNDLVFKKIQKYVVDTNGNSFSFYAMPKDKRRLVNEHLIKFECSNCHKPV